MAVILMILSLFLIFSTQPRRRSQLGASPLGTLKYIILCWRCLGFPLIGGAALLGLLL